MKKNKLLGIAIATLGAIVSIGSAFALYQKGFGVDNKQGAGFGGFTYQASSGAYTYLSSLNAGGQSGFTVASANQQLSPETGHDSVTYTFKIAAAYGSDSAGLVKQDSILGKLSITKSGALKDYLTMSAYVDGYAQNGEDNAYWAGSGSLSDRTLNGSGDTVSAHIPSPTSVSASMSAAESAGKYLTVHVTLSLTGMTDELFMTLNEADYNLAVSYTDIDATYGRPYIVGDGTGWALEDEYAMTPNLGASSFEWCFKDLNSDSQHTFSQMKVVKNNNDRSVHTDIWDATYWSRFGSQADNDANIVTDPETTYFVTYKGDDRGGFVVNPNGNIYQN